MKSYKLCLTTLGLGGLLFAGSAFATNPIIMDQFGADPTARVFEGKIYLYPSHDIPVPPGSGARQAWFCMEDYHVFSSENLTDWTDHGIICNQTNVPWLNRKGYDMWAPDCVFKNGTYYFYFPVGGRIGVATSDKPYGPWKVLDQPVTGASGIDPCVLQDDDGSAYLFTGGISVAKLKDNMIALDVPPPPTNVVANTNTPPGRGGRGGFGGRGSMQRIVNLPSPGLIEGSFAFKRNGTYYLTYPHAVTINGHEAERLEYSTSTNAMGPYTWAGIITDQNESGCWTEHHSIVQYKNQWYLFYHDKQLSPNFDKNRSVRVDYLTFNDDGTIKKVIPTLRGVGNVDAKSKIQIDRYSAISTNGVSFSFLDASNTFAGWKLSFTDSNGWSEFDRVDFGSGGLKSVNARAVSSTGGIIEIHLDKADGPLLARVEIGTGSDLGIVKSAVAIAPAGLHDLFFTQTGTSNIDVDWVSFE